MRCVPLLCRHVCAVRRFALPDASQELLRQAHGRKRIGYACQQMCVALFSGAWMWQDGQASPPPMQAAMRAVLPWMLMNGTLNAHFERARDAAF